MDDQTRRWLAHLMRGGAYGHWWTLEGMRSHWWEAARPTPHPGGRRNIYVGIHPTTEIPPTNRQGKATEPDKVRSQIPYIAAVNCLFGDFDAKAFGDDKEAAQAHAESLDPRPSCLVDSGGGYHGYWLLRDPWQLTDDAARDLAARTQAAWVTLVGGDSGAKDLARILRVPGTYNHKPEYGSPRPVTWVWCDLDRVYDLAELQVLCAPFLAAPAAAAAHLTGGAVPAGSSIREKRVQALFGQAIARLAAAPDGQKHDISIEVAKTLGGILELDEEAIVRACMGALGTRPKDYKNAEQSIRDGIAYGRSQPWDLDHDRPGWQPTRRTGASPRSTGWEPAADRAPEAPAGRQTCPPLPEAARLAPGLSAGACPWLDDYVAYSRQWSPRAYDGFHRSVGLWLLATVAARRVRLHFGGERYPSLYIALCARTSLYAKSTTARIGAAVLWGAGLSHMLAADDATPQAFVRSLTTRLPDHWENMDAGAKAKLLRRMAFPAQRGWWYDEFGQKVAAMMKDGGFMADFRGLLRRFDDCPPRYEYDSILRGGDVVEQPYLSLLANLTPADLKPYAGRDAALWGDGFWARFAFVTPPPDADRPRGRFPAGVLAAPLALTQPLRRWHERLGVPEARAVARTKGEEKKADGFDLVVDPLPFSDCVLHDDVKEAFYTYNDALLDVIQESNRSDLDGNYARFAEKALRVAMLAASLSNDGRIELAHWALGQEVAEQWRAELHHLVESLEGGGAGQSRESEQEERIVATIARLGSATPNDLRRHTHLSVGEVERALEALERAGEVTAPTTNRKGSKLYQLAGPIVAIGAGSNRSNTAKFAPIDTGDESAQANGSTSAEPGYVPNRSKKEDAATIATRSDCYDSNPPHDHGLDSEEDHEEEESTYPGATISATIDPPLTPDPTGLIERLRSRNKPDA
jgi:hypothetical protein